MRIAVLVVSRNRPDLVRNLAGYLERNMTYDHDLIVVEAGTDQEQLSEYSTLHFEDEDFRGKCFAHNVALNHAQQQAEQGTPYDYYWVLMNDLVFEEGQDAARLLVDTMEREPRLGILSPTCKDGKYPSSGRRGHSGWRAVTTCDYLGFMIRAAAVERVGFLNPEFKYCWGAIHELAYKLYSNGWVVAYSDEVEYEHLGGTTYGAKGTKTISREEYQVRAKRFAFEYFLKTYGAEWPNQFWSAAQGNGIEINTFKDHYLLWATAYQREELESLFDNTQETMNQAHNPSAQAKQQPSPAPYQLHLGCGPDRRAGWVNVDVNPKFQPDILSAADRLPMLQDDCCSIIESCHLFEHLTLSQARAALQEWRRLLVPGGELRLELPNLARCIDLVGTDMNGYDLGMISLFGYPPEVDEQGEPQLHKWGWTPESLAAELNAAGFTNVQQVPITQTERAAAKYDRDMRLVAKTPASAATVGQVASQPAASVAQPAAVQQQQDAPEIAITSVIAWPDYRNQAELTHFFDVFARVLSGRNDMCLHMRIDPELDPARDEVIQALEAAHASTLGATTQLNIALLEGPLSPREWREVGENMVCRVRTNSDAAPRDAARQMATPVVADAVGLFKMISGGSACASTDALSNSESSALSPTQNGVIIPAGVTPDPAVVARINELHPWFYPVNIDGMTVNPGIGSVCENDWLSNRAMCRATLLVEEVLARVDFRGKSVLDLACNCGFWSSHYALAGASKVLGVEGRQQHVKQAELYWERNGFLARDKYEFLEGNIADPRAWEAIRSRGAVDVTLCAGILYHIKNYAEVLGWAAELTREVMIVDTRVQDGLEETITEPGDLTFNAIAETRDKIVPDRKRLLQTIRDLGFEPEVMPVGFGAQLGVDDVDSYHGGARVTIVARKVKAALPSSSTHVILTAAGARTQR